MRKIKQTIKTAALYIFSIVLVGSAPMAAFADDSDACAGTGHWSKRWATDIQTGECVKLYDNDGVYVGPSYMDPNNAVAPAPVEETTPTPTPDPAVAGTPGVDAVVQDSGSGNTTGVDSTTNSDTATSIGTETTVNNDIKSTATSGGATVKGNESNGSATSGNTDTQATIVNSVHSTVDGGTGVATFTYDINGDVVGDITLNGNAGPVDVNNTTNATNDTTIDNKATLTNNVNLTSTSGDATVDGNESSGNATSGNANAVANILNLINTIIAANQSFVGTINIYGNLNGDILLSPELIPQLIAANGGTAISTTNLALSTNISDDTSIVNNVNLSATSGSATVDGNESNGSATSGDATASANIANISTSTFNLSGWFGVLYINVFGKWLGSFGVNTDAGTVTPVGGMAANQPSGSIDSPNLHFGFIPSTSAKSQFSSLALGTGDDSTATGAGAAALLASTQVKGASTGKILPTLIPVTGPHSDPFSVIMMVTGFSVAGISGSWMLIRRRMEMRAAASL